MKKYKYDLFALILLGITLPLFFYKLGQSSLTSFDEAWYADISRNILKTGSLFKLTWNGKIFNDHPPVGFWFTALSFKFLGISEFSARIVSAISGFLSLVFLYLLGKNLFNRKVGFVSAVALSSSNWFLFRARSGNLDSLLTMFFILTLLLGYSSSKNKKYLVPFSASLTLLLLIKTIAPITIIPTLIYIFWGVRNIKIKDLVFPFVILVVPIYLWLATQMKIHPDYLKYYFKIGLPGVDVETSFVQNLMLMKTYLHNGIGKWFWPGAISICIGFFTFQKRFILLSLFFASFFLPFLFSKKGHIWHLIPLHPIMILAFFGLFYLILEKLTKNKSVTLIIILLICVNITYKQIKRNWYEFVNIPAFVSDEAILSKEAGKYSGKLFIDGDYVPAAVFYSGKNVRQLHARAKQFQGVFDEEDSFHLITYKWRLEAENIIPNQYEIIKTDRDKILVKNITK